MTDRRLRGSWIDLPVADPTTGPGGLPVFDVNNPPPGTCFTCRLWAMGYDPHVGRCRLPRPLRNLRGRRRPEPETYMVDGCRKHDPLDAPGTAARAATFEGALRQIEADRKP